ncbi:MAG: PepSY-associated TM helix domain-containing protein [Gammaproteobacteria bacterium]|nr:PepSY-associated TM helix domain-containing protein [Gammaproteobacteria bacterium]
MTNRSWFRLHSFTGVITGLMLFVICWSGTFAVLSNELDWLVTPEARTEPGQGRASWGAIKAHVEQAYPKAEITLLSTPLYTRSAAQVLINLPAQESVWVYVNPYTAEVQGHHSYFNIQRFFRSFHYALFLPKVGLYVVTAFSITMLASLVAALLFYKRWWTRFFRFKRGGGRVFWSELHKTSGLWSIWFVLLMGLTGVWYLYEAAQPGPVNYVDGAIQAPAPSSDTTLPALPLDDVIAEAKVAWPDFEIGSIGYGWYSPGADTVYLEGQAEFPLVRDRANQMHLDPRTGEVLWQNSAGDLPLYWLWSNMADPLHFGDFAGLWSKGIWFIFGLLLSGLVLTGTWLHAQRLAREAGGRSRHRWPGTGAAITVSLLVLAASVPFGFQEARDYYGPTVDGVKQLPALAPGVKAVIIGWVSVTLAIIAGWIWMLWKVPARRSEKPRVPVKPSAGDVPARSEASW